MESLLKYKRTKKGDDISVIPIFIVDDDLSYLYSISTLLSRNPLYKTYCYTNGEDCIKNMKLNPFVIILDYFLNSENPKMINGLEVLKKIKSKSKVIMLSGQKTLDVAVNALKIGAYTYVVKDINALASVVHTVDVLCNTRPVSKGT